MAQIILDISANTHRNDYDYYVRMIEELHEVDKKKHEIVLKWQLFSKSIKNVVPDKALFAELVEWAWYRYGYKTTSSVFDLESLNFLLQTAREVPYELPFIKIANRRDLNWLIGEIPRKYKVYQSISTEYEFIPHGQFFHTLSMGDIQTSSALGIVRPLFCVSEYPAPIEKYPDWCIYISDHTIGLELWHRNKPEIWEKHYKLPDSTGLDAGEFATTPEELKEIL